ncbi:MAG: hypothetical protein HYY23_12270 [Verrucomicrobia bacterium]|nr:hypothetical protein [Verrucomicrobiota bacterium]
MRWPRRKDSNPALRNDGRAKGKPESNAKTPDPENAWSGASSGKRSSESNPGRIAAAKVIARKASREPELDAKEPVRESSPRRRDRGPNALDPAKTEIRTRIVRRASNLRESTARNPVQDHGSQSSARALEVDRVFKGMLSAQAAPEERSVRNSSPRSS